MVSQDGRNSIGLGALPDVGDPGKPGSVCESHTPATRLLREDPRCECDTHRQSQPPSLCYPRPRPIDRSGHSPWRSPCRQDCPRRHLAHEFGDHDPIKPMLFLGLGANCGVSEFRCQSIFSPGGLYARASISCRQASVPKRCPSAQGRLRMRARTCEFRCHANSGVGASFRLADSTLEPASPAVKPASQSAVPRPKGDCACVREHANSGVRASFRLADSTLDLKQA